MKRKIFSLAMVVLLLSTTGAAQSNTKPSSTKAIISGKVSDDRKTLIGDRNTWSVNNPASLAGREGRIVRVKCRLYAATNKILVLSVKPADAQIQYAAYELPRRP
jgi:hypothetical protein